jgi:hypothetical protein
VVNPYPFSSANLTSPVIKILDPQTPGPSASLEETEETPGKK